MMNWPHHDSIAIDTNVFEHLLNPQMNVDHHIDAVLSHLSVNRIILAVDDGGRIAGEYQHILEPIIRNANDQGPELYMLRYWMTMAPRITVPVDFASDLMIAIRNVIIEMTESVDRIFVYVALSLQSSLVSNDVNHIVVGPTAESRRGERRRRVLRNTRRYGTRGAEIITSLEAYAKI